MPRMDAIAVIAILSTAIIGIRVKKNIGCNGDLMSSSSDAEMKAKFP